MTPSLDTSVGGDDDKWMLFERMTSEGHPLVVLRRIDNSMVDGRLRSGIISVVRCQADAEFVNDAGMPQYTDRIYSVEEELARELQNFDAGVFHVASITGVGERRMVYAHEHSLEFDPILRTLFVDGYSISAFTPDDRPTLIDLVTPTTMERQLDGDRGVISNLEQNGDDGSVSRKTDFWFYGDRIGLERLAADLEPWGYSVDHWLTDPEGVVLTTETAVDFGTFREMTPVLVGAAERYGVAYDGWETFVVHPCEPEPVQNAKPQSKSLLSKLFGAKQN